MASEVRSNRRQRPVSVAGLLTRFSLAGLIVTAVVGTVLALVVRQAGTAQAIDSARNVALVTGRGIAEPRLTAGVLAGRPSALADFDQAMRRYVLQGSLVRIKIWRADGKIIYSDEARLIGRTFPLAADERRALDERSIDSEISDLNRPENEFERSFGKLLEVYVGIRSDSGERLLFEAYFRYDGVLNAAQAQWRRFAPPTLAGLIALQLVQIPFAWSLARRLQRQQQDRQRLLQHAVAASETERRRIAGDLHDGVVQQLTGITYALDAARLGSDDPVAQRELITRSASQLRHSVGELRSLLVDIYPANLSRAGLGAALSDLADGLEQNGLTVDIDVDGVADVPPEAAAVLYRCAQEVLRNVASHSNAQRVEVTGHRVDGQAVVVIDDDGRGFEPEELESRLAEGHIGLRSIGDLVSDAGGTLVVHSAAGQGTRVEIAVPLGVAS